MSAAALHADRARARSAGAQDGGDAARHGRRAHALAAAALALVGLSVMSGHMASVDGLLMQRQAQSIVLDGSLRFRSPVWTWTSDPFWTSQYGIGTSLLYVPGYLVAAPLAPMVPQSADEPRKAATHYYRQLYEDPIYLVGGSWVHALVFAASAWAVARLATALGASVGASLWAMVLASVGSIAFAYSRGDFAQPLLGLCWTAGLLAAVRQRREGTPRLLAACAAVVLFAVLVRPFEGLLLVPAVLVVLAPSFESVVAAVRRPTRETITALAGGGRAGAVAAVGAAAATGVAITLAINFARFGDPMQFGYTSRARWMLPSPDVVAAALVSPARGILWQFPALVLVPYGVAVLRRSRHGKELAAMLLLVAAMFATTIGWHVWWGGWFWGLRLFVPAIPLLAVLAGLGVDRLGAPARRRLPPALCAVGFTFALPCVLTDSLAGWAKAYDGAEGAWRPDAFPLAGAWRFLERAVALDPLDTRAIDIVWLRLAHSAGDALMLVPLVLLAGAAALSVLARREARHAADLRPADSAAAPRAGFPSEHD